MKEENAQPTEAEENGLTLKEPDCGPGGLIENMDDANGETLEDDATNNAEERDNDDDDDANGDEGYNDASETVEEILSITIVLVY